MTGEAPRLDIPAEPSEAHRQAVLDVLSAHNEEAGYPGDSRPLAILLRDGREEIVGGLWGRTGYGWLFVEFLFVPDALRGSGLGARLMLEAERIARERGCGGAWLTTLTFQSARGFYESLGYAILGSLPATPVEGQARLLMSKRFAA